VRVGHGCKLTCAALINNFSNASHQYAWTTRRTAARMKVARASAQASGPGTAVGRRELVASSSRLVLHGKRLRGSSIPSWVLPTGRIRGHDDELLLLLLLLPPASLRPPQISPLLLPASSSCCNNVKTDHDLNSTASEEHKSTKLHTKQTNKINLSFRTIFFFFLGL
jgi:hypothetical protein